MLKKSFLLALVTLLFITACNQNTTLYRVVKIKDGDTMELLSPDHQNITVRLAVIDCPEKSQAFGQAAKQFTADLCFGKMVRLEVANKDRYGRTVGTVFLEDGTNINYEIVKNGYAWQYRAYSKNMQLSLMEQHARQNHMGLWQDANPTPPWNFRKNAKTMRPHKPAKTAKPAKKPRKKRKHRQQHNY
jgi:micrococcal nuclease